MFIKPQVWIDSRTLPVVWTVVENESERHKCSVLGHTWSTVCPLPILPSLRDPYIIHNFCASLYSPASDVTLWAWQLSRYLKVIRVSIVFRGIYSTTWELLNKWMPEGIQTWGRRLAERGRKREKRDWFTPFLFHLILEELASRWMVLFNPLSSEISSSYWL